MRFTVRVRPGAGRTAVGGLHDGALVVAVTAKPVEGRATAAVEQALAAAFDVAPRQVRLVSGTRSRVKVFEIDDPTEGSEDRLRRRYDALSART